MGKNYVLDTGSRIFHSGHPRVPGIRFEWHPVTKKLFFIRIGAVPEFGQLIADKVPDELQARLVINAWVHGYIEARAEERARWNNSRLPEPTDG